MKVIGIIPARYSSTRFEGKILAELCGKPMIQHVWERARQARLLEDLIIACDDERVFSVCRSFGAHVAMTARGHASGSDRIAEVVQPLDVEVIVNIQGDEPLVQPRVIDALGQALLDDASVAMATVIKKIEDPGEIADPNVVKAVVDRHGFALYFSRAPIPFLAHGASASPVYFKHMGMYAYTKDFLFTYRNLPASALEATEKLEQLRVLEGGFRIKTIETASESVGVDTPQDLEKARQHLERLMQKESGE